MATTYQNILQQTSFTPPSDWLRIRSIEMHTGGEPLRVIIDGFPELKGDSVLDYRNYCKANYDHLRRALMHEPRGHADMYGLIKVPPERSDSSFGVIFMHNEGYSTMCGHAIIALSKFVIESGLIQKDEENPKLIIDAPPGQIRSQVFIKKGRVESTSFYNVESFVLHRDQKKSIKEESQATHKIEPIPNQLVTVSSAPKLTMPQSSEPRAMLLAPDVPDDLEEMA